MALVRNHIGKGFSPTEQSAADQLVLTPPEVDEPRLWAADSQRLAAIVLHAAALDTREREAYLQEATVDPALLAEARRRLASAEDLGSSFLAEPLGDLFASSQPKAAPGTTMPPGKIIGSYRLESLLGHGGMGEVYEAYDQHRDGFVAIKRIRSELLAEPERCVRFRREARALAQLGHPAIVRILDFLEADGDEWIVMELIDGPTLAEILRSGPLDVEVAILYGQQIASALAAAHERGLVHRDLKTENVMSPSSGPVKVLDFGLALRMCSKTEGNTFPNSKGQILGTPRTMSPEQSLGRELDARSDLFSFGVLLYELLTAHSPFLAGSPYQTLERVRAHHPPPVQRLNPQVPKQLSDLVAQLLEKDPARRGNGAAAEAQALAELSSSASSIPLQSVAAAPSGRAHRSNRLRVWQPPELPDEPYPVLLAYSHPALLAGRDAEIAELRDRLRMHQPVLSLYGPSGVGKSSLLLGGLVPLLRAEGRPVAVVRYPQEAGVAQRLVGDLLMGGESLADHDGEGFVERLREVERLAAQPAVLVIDQFDDVLRSRGGLLPLATLLAATVRAAGGEAPCRWLLAYRQEFHGRVEVFLRDALNDRQAALFHSLPLSPLATPSGGLSGEVAVEDAKETFLAAIEKPLAVRREDATWRYPWRFAVGHAERLARAFAEVRVEQHDAPLVPELQVVLAHLMARARMAGPEPAPPTSAIELPEDPRALITEALDDHLRRALKAVFPESFDDDSDVRARRARALLALYELAAARDQRLLGEDLIRVIGEDGEEVLTQLATPLTRLVVPEDDRNGVRYALSHDRMAEAIVRMVDEEGRRGKLLVDAELLALRRFVSLKAALHRSGEEAATRMPRRSFRKISEHTDALLWDAERRSWWAACRARRRADRKRLAVAMAAAPVVLALMAWAAWHLAHRWQEGRERQETVVNGEPEAAFRALVELAVEPAAVPEKLRELLKQRASPTDLLELGLGAFDGAARSMNVLRVVQILLPWVAESPEDPVLLASLVWALDYSPGRDPLFAEEAQALRDRVLERLRQSKPPPELDPGAPDWVAIPAGSFWMGATPEEAGWDSELPLHKVTLSDFTILRHEVTHAQFRQLFDQHTGPDVVPVGWVTWYEAYTYAAWLGGRLPTEAEWEYAARAGCPHAHCTRQGRRASVDEVAWTMRNAFDREARTLRAQPGMLLEPNPWGLFDMYGNLWEWTAGWSDTYSAAPQQDPWGGTEPTGVKRAARGGSYWISAADSRAANRGGSKPGMRHNTIGFRVVIPKSRGI